jgi:hypothetical protein
MIRRLVLNDLSRSKHFILLYSLLGIGVLSLILVGSEEVFFISTILVITCLIGVGLHPMFTLVQMERKEQNFPFVMSLPITNMDYTVAKVISVYCFALIPWTLIVSLSALLIFISPEIYDGFFGPALVIMLEILTAYSIALCVALVFQHEGAIVVAIVFGNIFANLFITGIFRLESVQSMVNSPVFQWQQVLTNIVAIEISVMALFIGIACFVQSRKKDLL